jgi:glutamate synthase domain-containing protein 2
MLMLQPQKVRSILALEEWRSCSASSRSASVCCSRWPSLLVLYFYLKDITQKKHAILRNFPLIGRLRYFFEQLGEYFRQYFFLGDRDERPFNRATRGWVYRMAKNEGGVLGFGSTYNLHEPGADLSSMRLSRAGGDRLPTPPLPIGEGYCAKPFVARSIVNVSGMSFGAISKPAVQALSRGAPRRAAGWIPARAGCRPITSKAVAT